MMGCEALQRAREKLIHAVAHSATYEHQARSAVWGALDGDDASLDEAVARAMCSADGVDPEAVDYKGAKAWREYAHAALVARLTLQQTISRQVLPTEERQS